MPQISRWFIKSGMIYLLLGIILAFLAEMPFIDTGALLLPVYWHMLVIGWITQVIMGVSIWMFPRQKRKRKNIQTIPALLAFWLLNTGLILRFVSEPFIPLFHQALWITLTVIASSILLSAAMIFYVIEIWPRVFSRKKIQTQKSK